MSRHRPGRATWIAALFGIALVAAACASSASPSPSSSTAVASAVPSASIEPSRVPSPRSDATPTPPATAAPTAIPAPTTGTWMRLAAAGNAPTAREDHTWTVDPDGATAWLFGGRDGSRTSNELWAYDLASDTWSRIVPIGSAPPGRFGHDAVWVPGTGLVIYGGQANATTFFDDLWRFDPQTLRWTKLPVTGGVPTARYGSCASLGPDGRLWMSHGFTEDGTRFADTQAFDFVAGRWTDVTPTGTLPIARCLHSCWWTPDGRFVLYAGQTTGIAALGDLWILTPGAGDTPGTWAKAEIERPPDRNLYALALRGEHAVVIGGRGLGQTFLSDVYVVDPVTFEFTPVAVTGTGPAGRGGAALVDDPDRGRMLLFGGKTGSGALADLWSLELR